MSYTLFADGFDDAVIGLDTTGDIPRVVYCVDKMVFILMHRDSMTEEEAVEFIDFNVTSAYLGGEGAPIYINQMKYNEAIDTIESLLWDN